MKHTAEIRRHLYADLPLPEDLRRWDRRARQEFGIPGAALMENAARGAYEEIRRRLPLRPDARILIFMGKGNNGGDGAALARMFADDGLRVLICATSDLSALPSPADEHCRAALRMPVNVIHANKDAAPTLPRGWSRPDLVIDALTGTGLKGPLRQRERAFVRAVNRFQGQSFIVALDAPSGLCGLTGRPLPEAVRARLTIAFEAVPLGLRLARAEEYTGEITVRRVGIPLAARDADPAFRLLAPRPSPHFAPGNGLHKGSAGQVLVIGGSESMIGAPCLAAYGALRGGAGLAHLAVPGALADLCAFAPEPLVHGIGKGRTWSADNAEALLALVKDLQPGALVIGPGMGRNAGAQTLVRTLLCAPDRPVSVIDADALYALRNGQNTAQALALHTNPLPATDILTPHPAEAARLLPQSFFASDAQHAPATLKNWTARLQERRPEALAALCALSRASVVLKGANTLIGQRGSPATLSPFAVPTLAVGGSGDVLAGLIAALAASGMPGLDAACLGVYLHGRAGELLAEKAPLGHLAREIADALPKARKELCPA